MKNIIRGSMKPYDKSLLVRKIFVPKDKEKLGLVLKRGILVAKLEKSNSKM